MEKWLEVAEFGMSRWVLPLRMFGSHAETPYSDAHYPGPRFHRRLGRFCR